MTTPLQSTEYAALIAAKEAHSIAVARHIRAKDELLFVALNEGYGASFDDLRELALEANRAEHEAEAAVTAAQAAFDAAYPAPADVVAAVDALRSGHEAIAYLQARFDASLTDEQRELKEAMAKGEQNNIERLAHAKALIEAAQVSPSKAFVVKRSVKASLDDPYQLIDMIDQRDAPIELIKIDETALAKWVNKMGSVELDVELNETVSVAFYAAKL